MRTVFCSVVLAGIDPKYKGSDHEGHEGHEGFRGNSTRGQALFNYDTGMRFDDFGRLDMISLFSELEVRFMDQLRR